MRASTQSERYTRVAIFLHWAIALSILHNLCIGFFMGERGVNPLHNLLMNWHVSFGFTVLGLTAIRIFWRLMHKPPPFPADMKPWEIKLAHVAHFLLYFFMVAMPVTGWSILSSNPNLRSLIFWWLPVRIPTIAPLNRIEPAAYQLEIKHLFEDLHLIGAWIMVFLLVLHVAAALKHQFFDHHNGFQRMGIGRDPASLPFKGEPRNQVSREQNAV